MQPTPGDVHVNVPLTNISVAYMQNAANFIAARVFPNIPVQKQSDRYYTYDRGMFNRDEMKERAPGTEAEGGGYDVDNTPNYFCRQYAFKHDIPDEVRANADTVINADRDATALCTHKALIKRETVWASKFFVTGVWTHDKDGVASSPGSNQYLQWNDANSTPIEDIRAAKRTILEDTGFEPNKLTLGRKVYDTLLDHPDIIDRIKYGQTAPGPAIVNRMTLAALFEVDEILVSNAIKNTAKEGQTNAHSFIVGKHALLCYAPPSAGLMIPSAGYTFSWTGLMGNGMEGNRIRTFRMEKLNSDRVQIEMSFDQKVIAADLGWFLEDAVA